MIVIESLWQSDARVWMKHLIQKVSDCLIMGSERGYQEKDLLRNVRFLSPAPPFTERIPHYLDLWYCHSHVLTLLKTSSLTAGYLVPGDEQKPLSPV